MNAADKTVPAEVFLDACPGKVGAEMLSVLHAVAAAPPPAFSFGGMSEAMHAEMSGFYEVRTDGPKREQFRLFCVLERDGKKLGLGGPSIVLIDGRSKAFKTTRSRDEQESEGRRGKRRPPPEVTPVKCPPANDAQR